MQSTSHNSGFSLLEMVIALAIFSLLMIGIITMTMSTEEAYVTIREDTEANYSLRQALTRISNDLRQSSTSIVVITPGAAHDKVEFQLPISQTGSTITWGAEGQPGWRVLIFVEEGMLIRRVVDAEGMKMRMDTILARDVDDLFEGEKGFSITTTFGLCQIALRVTAERKGRTWRRSETTSVAPRN